VATASIAGLPDKDLVAALAVDAGNIRDLLATATTVAAHLGGSLDASIDPGTGHVHLAVTVGGDS
jgi:hypothetical protein